MSFLLLWHPKVGSTPPIPPGPTPSQAVEFGGGGAVNLRAKRRRRRLQEDDEDILAVLAAFMTQRRH